MCVRREAPPHAAAGGTATDDGEQDDADARASAPVGAASAAEINSAAAASSVSKDTLLQVYVWSTLFAGNELDRRAVDSYAAVHQSSSSSVLFTRWHVLYHVHTYARARKRTFPDPGPSIRS